MHIMQNLITIFTKGQDAEKNYIDDKLSDCRLYCKLLVLMARSKICYIFFSTCRIKCKIILCRKLKKKNYVGLSFSLEQYYYGLNTFQEIKVF